MSDENQNNSDSVAPAAGSNQNEGKDAYVPKKAYEEVTRDMHKNKQKAKELEAEKNALLAQLKAQEEAKMQEQEQYKELFQKRDAELEAERKRAEVERNRFSRAVKVTALKSELGGKIRDEYLSHANIDGIVVSENGTIDAESLRNVANDFRKEHGQLIPQSSAANVTGHAASQDVAPQQVDISQMSGRQLAEYYAKLKSKQ